jgi:hypothetical protein
MRRAFLYRVGQSISRRAWNFSRSAAARRDSIRSARSTTRGVVDHFNSRCRQLSGKTPWEQCPSMAGDLLVFPRGENVHRATRRRSHLPARQLIETACYNYEPVFPPSRTRSRLRGSRAARRFQNAPQRPAPETAPISASTRVRHGRETGCLRLTPASVALFRASGDTPEKTGTLGWGTWIRTRINGVRVASPGPW